MPGALRHRTAPQASRRQPGCGRNRLPPGRPRRGRNPMTQYRSNNRAYVIPSLKEDTASGRVKEIILFSPNIFHKVKNVW